MVSTNKRRYTFIDIKKPRFSFIQSAALWIKGEQSVARKLELSIVAIKLYASDNRGRIDSV